MYIKNTQITLLKLTNQTNSKYCVREVMMWEAIYLCFIYANLDSQVEVSFQEMFRSGANVILWNILEKYE